MIYTLLWLIAGILAAGILCAYVESFPTLAEENLREDLGLALFIGLVFGPIALLVAVGVTGFAQHGWRLWRKR